MLALLAATTLASAAAAHTVLSAQPLPHHGYVPDPAWAPAVPKNVTGVSACAVSAMGASRIYVGQRGKGAPPIQVLDSKTGKYIASFGQDAAFKNVHGVHMQATAAGTEYLWVTDSGAGMVHKFEAATGKLLQTIGSRGTGIHPPQFGSVADIAFDAAGAVYISDGDGGPNARVIKLDASMKLQWVVGNNGTVSSFKTPFKSPHSLAYCAKTDVIFVADRNNNQLRSFDAKTGEELGSPWQPPFDSASCAKPAVWSVRVDSNSSQVFVANSNFGSGSACPACSSPTAACHTARVTVVPVPPKAFSLPSASTVIHIPVAHGFPHEICVDHRDGSVYSAAVDSKDLPAGRGGINALTKYKPA